YEIHDRRLEYGRFAFGEFDAVAGDNIERGKGAGTGQSQYVRQVRRVIRVKDQTRLRSTRLSISDTSHPTPLHPQRGLYCQSLSVLSSEKRRIRGLCLCPA